MWRALIGGLFPDARFAPPAAAADLAAAERALAVAFPPELRALLLESNGVQANYGAALIWPVERIFGENLDFRRNDDFKALYMPFDCLLFVGEEGNGDQFGYRILAGGITEPDLFEWDHETDSRVWFASNLQDYFARLPRS